MIVNAIKNTGEWAGRVSDLSAKLGISKEAVQRLDHAAKQSGSSIEAVSGALSQMGNRLVEGGSSTVGALKQLNLSLDDLRKMSPDEAFATLASAIAAVPDPMQRTALAMDLFGKSGTDLLPMMGDLERNMQDAVVASDSMIEAGDRLGDSWDKMTGAGSALLAGVLVPLEPALTAVARAAGGFAQKMFDMSEASSEVLSRPGLLSRSGVGILQDISKELNKIDINRLLPKGPQGITTSPFEALVPTDAETRAIEKRSREIESSYEKATEKQRDWTRATSEASNGMMLNLARWAAMPPAISDTAREIIAIRSQIAGATQNFQAMNLMMAATAKVGVLNSQSVSQELTKAQGMFDSFFSNIKGGFASIWQGMSGGSGFGGLLGISGRG